MTTETKQTGATDAQIEAAVQRWLDRDLPYRDHDNLQAAASAQVHPFRARVLVDCACYLVTEDMCIVPRSFVSAVDAAISEAEELDYSPPYIRIPLGKWHDVENARDTFKEGLRSSEPPSTAHATTVAQLERQCSLTFAAMTDAIDGLIARISALEAEIEAAS